MPLRVETGRYVGLPYEERICELCNKGVEDELHVLFVCEIYSAERLELFEHIARQGYINFHSLTDVKKMYLLCTLEARKLAKYIVKIYDKRQQKLYSKSN